MNKFKIIGGVILGFLSLGVLLGARNAMSTMEVLEKMLAFVIVGSIAFWLIYSEKKKKKFTTIWIYILYIT